MEANNKQPPPTVQEASGGLGCTADDGGILRCEDAVSKGMQDQNNQTINAQRRTGHMWRILFNPFLHLILISIFFSTLIIISNLFLQSMTEIRAGTVHTTTCEDHYDHRMLNGGPARSPVIIYYRTQNGARIEHIFIQVCALITMAFYHHIVRTCMAHIFVWVCALVHDGVLPSILRSPPRPPISPADGRHPPAPPPRRSCHQVEACCTFRITWAAWRTDKESTLIRAKRRAPGVPERACGTGAALGQ